MGSFLNGLFVGIGVGVLILAFLVQDEITDQRNAMCSGKPLVVVKEDTIRTFTCKVELK